MQIVLHLLQLQKEGHDIDTSYKGFTARLKTDFTHHGISGGTIRDLERFGRKNRRFERKLAESMEQVIATLLEGREVTVMSDAVEMTTTMAAKKLGISRPTLMHLISSGEIPGHKVGSHYRLLTSGA